MKWYRCLYMGEQAKKNRYKIVKKIRWNQPQVDIYVITLARNQYDLLDIYPASVLRQKYFQKHECFVVGIAKGYKEALEVVTRIVMDVYTQTGTFDIKKYIGR